MSKHADYLLGCSDRIYHGGYVEDAAKFREAAAHIKRLEALLKECADDLAERVDQEYPDREQYPDMMRRYERDMDCVYRARAAIGTDSGEDEA